MALEYETKNFQSSLQDQKFDDSIYNNDHHHPHNLSSLSICSSTTSYDVDNIDDEDVDNAMSLYMSQLYMESFDADAEFSDTNDEITQRGLTLSPQSENDVLSSCYTLPHMINHVGYASTNNEEELQKGCCVLKTNNNDPTRSRSSRTKWDHKRWSVTKNLSNDFESSTNKCKKKEEENLIEGFSSSESGENGTIGVRVITRPKGGKRCLCMDLEEVKACRDLGFELEHQRMLDNFPSYVSFSNSTFDTTTTTTTSSGANSPIPNLRISSPGDDPKDVKARLKVWAQVVALVSTSKYAT